MQACAVIHTSSLGNVFVDIFSFFAIISLYFKGMEAYHGGGVVVCVCEHKCASTLFFLAVSGMSGKGWLVPWTQEGKTA